MLPFSSLHDGTEMLMAFYQQAPKLVPAQGVCSPIEVAANVQGELQDQE